MFIIINPYHFQLAPEITQAGPLYSRIRTASKIKIYKSIDFLLDKSYKVWFHIVIKRLVTSPKLLSTSHGQQHFFVRPSQEPTVDLPWVKLSALIRPDPDPSLSLYLSPDGTGARMAHKAVAASSSAGTGRIDDIINALLGCPPGTEVTKFLRLL